jgi:CopG family nickel-responsive transcriptional regulator
MEKQGVKRISISLPPDLLEDFEAVIKEMGYDRSKAIQQAMRGFISDYRWDHNPTAFTVGTITLIYHHDVRGVESELTDIQHQYPNLITSSTHVHLDAVHCLLVIVVKGYAKQIQSLALELKRLRGVKQLKLTGLVGTTPTPHEHSH